MHICVTPSVDGVGLVEYFCTHPIYICGFSPEEDPDFVVEDVELRLRPNPNLACGVGPLQDDSASASL